MGQVEPHECVTGLQTCHQNSHVGLGSGMRLDIGVFSLEKLAYTLDGKLLYLVYDFTSSVISCSGITFGILVRANRAEGRKHLLADIVLRGDELQP